MTDKRRITAEDLYELKSVADPRLASNGKDCVFVQTEILADKDEYCSNIYYLNIEKREKPVQWTFGENRNHSPRWSPDGSKLAFVSNRSGKNQIYVMSMNGGEAKQLTNCKNGASNPVWSPNSEKIAFSVLLEENECVDNKVEKNNEKEKLVPLVIDKMKYKTDAEGFLEKKYAQIAIVDVLTGKKELLTKRNVNHTLHAWSPDGSQLVFTANMNLELDFSFVLDVYLLHVESKELKKLTKSTGYFHQITWSPNGKYLGIIGHEREFENATISKIWIYNLEREELSCLTKDFDIAIGDHVVGDFQQGIVTPGLLWTENSRGFYFIATDQGSTAVYYGSLKGEMYPIVLEQQHVYGLAIDKKNHFAVLAISKPTHPGDLFYHHFKTKEEHQLTAVNETFLNEVILAEPEAIQFVGAEDWNLHGWLMKPVNKQAEEKYPLILEVHGGPHAMYANTYFHEFQVLAANGYGILYTNPRGSHGYGQQFVDAVRGDYGGNDYKDLMSAVDYVLDTYPQIDKQRLGVTGGSYGGFMTNWIIGQTKRFKAAVTQRSISNWISFYGVSDIGYYFTEWQIKADISNVETLWKHSPLAYVNNIETPLLILHSEKDYRCPIEQAEQLFIALKRKKKTAKMIRFPESNHELSRSGNPNLRVERLCAIKEWFNSYLKNN
ncbi:S9 family peptidase [Bacillus aquiflavi]|uniref:S9 family peptidase n=1 Tax=Bacillus aquiflavi TaxID=2672567 RepID=A0A6B3VSY8_9BACI|nr:S9 family peptidase [Bacillus aquiflavi]MBA4535706.1 S9 family peptidase [Bacillus aquiflavi]NEY80082.1 S9 family peptidase [Bacillus aquiflavi]